MKIRFKGIEHFLEIGHGFAGSANRADYPSCSGVAVYRACFPSHISFVENNWKMKHFLDPGKHQREVRVPVDETNRMLRETSEQS